MMTTLERNAWILGQRGSDRTALTRYIRSTGYKLSDTRAREMVAAYERGLRERGNV